jgi:hypothetical protein
MLDTIEEYKDYFVWNDIFIFKTDFNDEITKHLAKLECYNKVIFSELYCKEDIVKIYPKLFFDKIIINNYYDMDANLINQLIHCHQI